MSRSVDIGIEERRKKPTLGRHRSGKSAFKHSKEVFYLPQTAHKPHFIYNLILLSSVGLLVTILEHIIISEFLFYRFYFILILSYGKHGHH